MRLVCPKNNACVTLWEGIVLFGNSKCTLYAQDQIQIVERKLSNSLFVRLNARFSPLNVRLLLQMCVYFVNSPYFFFFICFEPLCSEASSKLLKLVKAPSLRSARGSIFTCYCVPIKTVRQRKCFTGSFSLRRSQRRICRNFQDALCCRR